MSCSVFTTFRGGSYGRWGQRAFMYRTNDNVTFDDCWSDNCVSPDDTSLFYRRGWLVVKGLVSTENIEKILSGSDKKDCYPQRTEELLGSKECGLSAPDIQNMYPEVFENVTRLLHRVQRYNNYLGSNLELSRDPSAVRRIRVHSTRSFPWHVDNSGSSSNHNAHWMFVMLDKKRMRDNDGNLCLSSHSGVECFNTPGNRVSDHWSDRVLELNKCCPILKRGDAILYTEDVAHRTQHVYNWGPYTHRNALSFKIMPRYPPTFSGREELRCGMWRPWCDSFPEFMHCVCPHTC